MTKLSQEVSIRKICILFIDFRLVNNHTKVWGSFWKDGIWGYGCCQSNIKSSYCGGEALIEAIKDSEGRLQSHINEPQPKPSLLDQYVANIQTDKPKAKQIKKSKNMIGEGEVDLDKEKLQKELKKENERSSNKGKKRLAETEVTEESLEAYRLTKSHREDPMAKYLK